MNLTTDTIANSYYNLGSKVAMEKLAKISIPRALGSGAFGLTMAPGFSELTRMGLKGSSKYLDDFYTRTGIIDRLPQYDADIKLLNSLIPKEETWRQTIGRVVRDPLHLIQNPRQALNPAQAPDVPFIDWAIKMQTIPHGRMFNTVTGTPETYLSKLKDHLAEETETLSRLGGRDLSTMESALDYVPAAVGAGLGGLTAQKLYKLFTRLNKP